MKEFYRSEKKLIPIILHDHHKYNYYNDLTFLSGLLNMYERQLDTESMAYHQARGALFSITNDIRNTFATTIQEQEKEDDNLIVSIKKSPRNLKPIAKVPPIKHLPLMDKKNQSYSYVHQRHHLADVERRRTTFSGLLPAGDKVNSVPKENN